MRIERVKSTTRSWIAYVMRINRLFSFSMHEIIHRLDNFVPAAPRTAAITTHTFAAVDRNILTVAWPDLRNSAHLHDPVAGSPGVFGSGHGLISSGVARRASDRTIARLCGGHNFSLPGGGDSFVDAPSVGVQSSDRTRAIARSPAGREEEGATPFLRPGGGGEERRKKCGMERR